MSMIKVNCPSCKSPLQIAEQKLRETQGRVVCHECQHIFRLVKKNKKADGSAKKSPSVPSGSLKADKPVFNDVGVRDNAAEPVWPTDGWPSGGQEENKRTPAAHAQGSRKKTAHKPQKQRLSYRIPKAGDKPAFADVEQQKPFAFNLLDSQAASIQVPQVAVNPDPAQMAQQALQQQQRSGSDQQNNITIHTGSLVFTVMGDSQGATTTLTAPDGSKFAEPSVQGVPTATVVPVVQQQASELPWTIATMSALIIFIVQLVYLYMVLQ